MCLTFNWNKCLIQLCSTQDTTCLIVTKLYTREFVFIGIADFSTYGNCFESKSDTLFSRDDDGDGGFDDSRFR